MSERMRTGTKALEAKKENSVSRMKKAEVSHSMNSPVQQVLSLQRTIGNQAVQRLMKSGALQAKLKIGQPGDVYEQEADRVAERVMRMQEPKEISGKTFDNHVQRVCPKCTDCGQREEEEVLQSKAASGSTPEIAPELEANINAVRDGGEPLPESVRDFFEPRFEHDFRGVRIHTEGTAVSLAQGISAQAFTHGQNIYFDSGRYQPQTNEGQHLLAHELTHVAQQGFAVPHAAKSIQRKADATSTDAPPGTERLEPEQEKSKSLGVDWYIELEPATPIIVAGTMVIFRLRNSRGEGFAWEIERADLGHRPVFILREPSGQELVLYTSTQPQEIRYSFEQPGHYKATFRGRPMRLQGPVVNPGALTTTGSEITVSVEFDVSRTLGQEVLEGEGARKTERADIAQLERPDAAEGEIAAAFQRIAVRLGFQALEEKRREAEEQLKLYTTGAAGKTPTQAIEELSAIMRLDDELDWKLERLTLEPLEVSWVKAVQEGYNPKSLEDVRALRKEREERIIFLREALVDAYPGLAVVKMGELRTMYGQGSENSRGTVEIGLRRVLGEIETTKRNLATGNLEILRVSPVVAKARDMLGIDADPRKKQVIDRLLKEHGAEEFERGLAVTGATIFLLFIPGVGPYLAAGLSGAWAARSWVRFSELSSAAGAGVRGGIIERREAAAAAFWSIMDVLGAGLDIGAALSTVRKIAPHVPEAIERVTARSGRRTVAQGEVPKGMAKGEVPEIPEVLTPEAKASPPAPKPEGEPLKAPPSPVSRISGEVTAEEVFAQISKELGLEKSLQTVPNTEWLGKWSEVRKRVYNFIFGYDALPVNKQEILVSIHHITEKMAGGKHIIDNLIPMLHKVHNKISGIYNEITTIGKEKGKLRDLIIKLNMTDSEKRGLGYKILFENIDGKDEQELHSLMKQLGVQTFKD